MHNCSVTRHLRIEKGSRGDYDQLARYHYRDSSLAPYVAIYKLAFDSARHKINAGVIVYTMPSPGCELRGAALGDLFGGLDRSMRLALINKNIRTIARVIIEPRFRALGLAGDLVRRTIGRLNVPIVEALAVMGNVNPFFEKAGMRPYKAPLSVGCRRLIEAFSVVGIETDELIDPQRLRRKLKKLKRTEAEFVERQIRVFLQSYGARRNSPDGIERTRFVLAKLTERPVYYIWLNENAELKT